MTDIISKLPSYMQRKIVVSDDGCWRWSSVGWNGYGRVGYMGKDRKAHRAVYELLVGEVSRHLDLDHLCRVRCCVNPVHLEPVTRRENIMRGIHPSAIRAQSATCANGHEFTEQNSYMLGPKRKCRECLKAYASTPERRAAQRADALRRYYRNKTARAA